jgi:hypothetical protein
MGVPPQVHRRRGRLPDVAEFAAAPGDGLDPDALRTCEHCRWAQPAPRPRSFKCRRWPPVVHQARPGEALFPIVEHDDWCGEHQQ